MVLFIYGIMAYHLHLLARYGGKSRRIPVIVFTGLLLFAWFIWSIYQRRKKKDQSKKTKGIYQKIYLVIASLTILGITIMTGKSLYESSQAGKGQLFFYVNQFRNEKKLKFTKKNIYENDLDGIFRPLENKFDLPKELYLADDFLINFEKDGRITAYDGHFYGKNEAKESQSYLISYNEKESDKMTVYLDNEYEESYAEDKKLAPLFEIMDRISLEKEAEKYSEEDFRLTYAGLLNRNSLYKEIYWVKEDGTILPIRPDESGYTLNLYGKSRENYDDNLANYVYDGAKTLTDEEFEAKKEAELEEERKAIEWELGYNNHDGVESYFVSEKEGYQLSIVDAALGTRYYELLQTTDAGDSWQSFNSNPFLGEGGDSAGITFIDESLGFIALAKEAGNRALLYRTTDGGKSYEEVSIPSIEVPLTENESYEAFTFPGMPFEKNGKLYLSVGQGANGDYKAGVHALFVSEDRGETWEFLKEETMEN